MRCITRHKHVPRLMESGLSEKVGIRPHPVIHQVFNRRAALDPDLSSEEGLRAIPTPLVWASVFFTIFGTLLAVGSAPSAAGVVQETGVAALLSTALGRLFTKSEFSGDLWFVFSVLLWAALTVLLLRAAPPKGVVTATHPVLSSTTARSSTARFLRTRPHGHLLLWGYASLFGAIVLLLPVRMSAESWDPRRTGIVGLESENRAASEDWICWNKVKRLFPMVVGT